MPIVSSTHTAGRPQADGRRYVTEVHTDDAGVMHRATYLADVGIDHVAIRDARAVQINARLAEAEAQALLNDGA